MGFFDSSPEKTTETTTPSLAAQGAARARARMLMAVLQASAGRGKPSFAQWRGGAPMPNALPGGLEVGFPELLALMNRPGAFDTTRTMKKSGGGASIFSDLLQLGMTTALAGGPMGAGIWGGGKGSSGNPMNLLSGIGGGGGVDRAGNPADSGGFSLLSGAGSLSDSGGGGGSSGIFDSVLKGITSALPYLLMFMG